MRSWAISLAAIIGLAAPVAATPERVIWVEDRLFGRTADSVLVLRSYRDNHGSHYTTQTDTLLLTLAMPSGEVSRIATVERVVDVHLGEDDLDTVTYYPVEGPVNPYAARAAAGAAPVEDPTGPGSRTAILSPVGLTVADHEGAATHSLPASALRAQVVASLSRTRAVLPVLFTPPGTAPGTDPFDPRRVTLGSDCVPDATHLRWTAVGSEAALVRLACDDTETGARSTLWVVVPAIP